MGEVGGLVAHSDSLLGGHEFDSCLVRSQVSTLGKLCSHLPLIGGASYGAKGLNPLNVGHAPPLPLFHAVKKLLLTFVLA